MSDARAVKYKVVGRDVVTLDGKLFCECATIEQACKVERVLNTLPETKAAPLSPAEQAVMRKALLNSVEVVAAPPAQGHARIEALEEAARVCEPTMAELLLACGEMNASEKRIAKAVLRWASAAIRERGRR